MSTKIRVPEGWSSQAEDFSVELKPGKPEDATSWFDTQGRPAVKVGSTWTLQRQPPPPPRKIPPKAERKPPAPPKKILPKAEEQGGGRDAQARQPETSSEIELKPEEQEQYSKFSALAKEKLAQGTKKSFYPDPEQAKKDEDNRRRRFAPYLALSDDQLSAINAYTSEWDLNINSLLREGEIKTSYKQAFNPEKTPAPSEAQVKKAVKDLTSALESLPDAPEGEFHRAISGSMLKENGWEREPSELLKQLHALQDGDVIEDPGFSSFTAGGAPVLDQFMMGDTNSEQNIVFQVISNKMKNISPISRYEREKEHMLPPGSKFKVTGRSHGMSRKVGRYTVIILQQL
jgi:hypothetical protein